MAVRLSMHQRSSEAIAVLCWKQWCEMAFHFLVGVSAEWGGEGERRQTRIQQQYNIGGEHINFMRFPFFSPSTDFLASKSANSEQIERSRQHSFFIQLDLNSD